MERLPLGAPRGGERLRRGGTCRRIRLPRRRAPRRGRAARRDRRALRHALLRLFARRARGRIPGLRCRVRRRAASRLLRDEGELEPRRARTCSPGPAAASTSSRAASSRACMAAGGDPAKVVFSGVGKTAAEMEAALAAGILCFNVESEAELVRPERRGGKGGKGRAGIVSRQSRRRSAHASVHLDRTQGKQVRHRLRRRAGAVPARGALPHVAVHGIDCHIGSQITDLSAYVEAADKVFALVDRIEADGIALSHVDLGGGLGIRYRDEETIDPYEYALAVRRAARHAADTAAVRAGPLPGRPTPACCSPASSTSSRARRAISRSSMRR